PAPPALLLRLHRPSPSDTYSLSLHDALPIYAHLVLVLAHRHTGEALLHHEGADAPGALRLVGHGEDHEDVGLVAVGDEHLGAVRSEEHTSELQSRENLVCRLLLEKKKNIQK